MRLQQYSPSSLFIGNLKMKLEQEFEFDFHYKHPDPSVLEPLGVIGNPNTQNSKTAKTGRLIEDFGLQIDIYLPKQYNKLQVDSIRSKAVRIIGRKDVNSSISEDDSTNRKVWRINIRLTKII